jgi:hypothetical protein
MPTPGAPPQQAIDEVLNLASPALRPLVCALREQVLAMHPQANQLAWPKQRIISFGVGPRKMSEHYAYIAVQSQHINLGFYDGSTLADPAGLLEGSGLKLRHLKLSSLAQASAPPVLALLKQAWAKRRDVAPHVA